MGPFVFKKRDVVESVIKDLDKKNRNNGFTYSTCQQGSYPAPGTVGIYSIK